MSMRYSGLKLSGNLYLNREEEPVLTWVLPSKKVIGPYNSIINESKDVNVEFRAIYASTTRAGAITYSISNGTIDEGLTIDPTTGIMNGTLVVGQAIFDFIMRATFTSFDGTYTRHADKDFRLLVGNAPPPIWITPPGLLTMGMFGEEIDIQLEADDPMDLPVFYFLVDGSLPNGVHLNPLTGRLQGTMPTLEDDQQFDFSVSASNLTSNSIRQFSLYVTAPVPADAPHWVTPAGDVGSGYELTDFETQLVAVDPFDRDILYVRVSGNIPDGITIDPDTGLVSGTFGPVTDDTLYRFIMGAKAGPYNTKRLFEITVKYDEPPIFIDDSTDEKFIGPIMEGEAFSSNAATAIQRGKLPLVYTANGVIPNSISIDPTTGVISGVMPPFPANEQGTTFEYNFTVKVDTGIKTISRPVTITNEKNLPPVWAAPFDLGRDLGDFPFSSPVPLATDPNGRVVSYVLKNPEDLPSTLTWDASIGQITGFLPSTPTEDITISLDIEATDGVHTISNTFTITAWYNTGPEWVTPEGEVGTAVEGYGPDGAPAVLANDPQGKPIFYSLVSGALPPGLNLHPFTGAIYGTANAISNSLAMSEMSNFVVRASDGVLDADREFAFTVFRDMPPIWVTNAGTVLDVLAEQRFSFSVEGEDPNGKALTYKLINDGGVPSTVTIGGQGGGGWFPESLFLNAVNRGTPQAQFAPPMTDPPFFPQLSQYVYFDAQYFTVSSDPVTVEIPNMSNQVVQVVAIHTDYDTIVDPNTGDVTLIPKGYIYEFDNQIDLPYGAVAFNQIKFSQPDSRTEKDFDVTMSIDDGVNPEVWRTFRLHVRQNLAPVWQTSNTIYLANAYEQTFVSGQIEAIDPEGNAVVYRLGTNIGGRWLNNNVNGLQDIVLNGLTGEFAGHLPKVDQDTVFTVGVTAWDSTVGTPTKMATPTSFQFMVRYNSPPNWGGQNTELGRVEQLAYSTTLHASGQGNQAMDYSLANNTVLPPGLTLANNGVISGVTPAVSGDTDYPFSVRAWNGVKETYQDFVFTVYKNIGPQWVTPAGEFTQSLGQIPFSTSVVANDVNGAFGDPMFYTLLDRGTLPNSVKIANADGLWNNVWLYANFDNDFSDSQANTSLIANFAPIGAPTITDGKFRGALTLDGSSGLAGTIPAVANSAATFEFWFRRDDASDATLMALGDGGAEFSVDLVQDQVAVEFQGNTIITSNAVSVDDWHHLAFVRTGLNSFALYIDGFNEGLAVANAVPIVDTNLILGSKTLGGSNMFAGQIDDLRITPMARYAGTGQKIFRTDEAWDHQILPSLQGNLPLMQTDTLYSFTLRVSDHLAHADRTFTIRNLADMDPAWGTPMGHLTKIIEGKFLDLTVGANDPEGNAITYSLESGNLPFNLDPATGRIYGNAPSQPETPPTAQYDFTLRAYDGGFHTSDRTFSIVVEHNFPPVWQTPQGNIGAVLGLEDFSRAVVAYDPNEDDVVSYRYMGGPDPLPPGIEFNNGSFSGTLSDINADQFWTVEIEASDGVNNTYRQFEIHGRLNRIPVFVPNSGTIILSKFEQTEIIDPVVVQFYDPDGKTLAVEVDNVPEGIQYTSNSTHFIITGGTMPTIESGGDEMYTFSIKVDDGVREPTATFRIQNKYNSPPLWISPAQLPAGSESTQYEFTCNAVSNGMPVFYSVIEGSLPGTLTLNVTTGKISGVLPLAIQAQDTYTFTILATTGVKSTSQVHTLRVIRNRAPVWDTLSLAPVLENSVVNISLKATDPDGTVPNYVFVSGMLPAGLSFNGIVDASNSVHITGNSPVVLSDQEYNFTIGADDGYIRVDREFTLTIKYNEPPVFSTPTNTAVFTQLENTPLNSSILAVDAEGKPVKYSMNTSVIGWPSWLILNSNTGVLSGTAPIVLANTAYSFSVDATDGNRTRNQTFFGNVVNDTSYFDPFANAVSFLHHFNSAATTDEFGNAVSYVGGATIDTNIKKFGTGSLACLGTGYASASTPWNNTHVFANTLYTFEMWVHPLSTTPGTLMHRGDQTGNSGNPWVQIATGSGRYFLTTNSGASYDMGPITANTWTHLAFVRNGSQLRTFNNGALVATGTMTTNLSNFALGNFFYIGTAIGGQAFNGYIDEVRVTQAVRYTGNFNPQSVEGPTAPLVTTTSIPQQGAEGTPINNVTISAIVRDTHNSPQIMGFSITNSAVSGLTISNNGVLDGDWPPAGSPYAFDVAAFDSNLNYSPRRRLSLTSTEVIPTGLMFQWRFNRPIGSTNLNPNYAHLPLGAPQALGGGGSPQIAYEDCPDRPGETALHLSNYSAFTQSTGVGRFPFLATGPFTFEMWVYIVSYGSNGNRTLFSVNGNEFRVYRYDQTTPPMGDGRWRFNYNEASAGAIVDDSQLPLNQWCHVAVVRDTSNFVTMYRDGVGGTPVLKGAIGSTTFNSTTLGMNTWLNSTGYPLQNVYIRAVNLWQTARYNGNFTPTWPGFGND